MENNITVNNSNVKNSMFGNNIQDTISIKIELVGYEEVVKQLEHISSLVDEINNKTTTDVSSEIIKRLTSMNKECSKEPIGWED